MGAKPCQFHSGQFLFNEGDPAYSMFLIQKGTVSIRKRKLGGYIEIARIHPNEVIGELSFFDRAPRSAAAVAISEVHALEIDFASVDKLYKNIPSYFQTIMACVADRLKQADSRIQRLQDKLVEDQLAEEPQTHSETSEILSLADSIDDPKKD